MRPLAVLPVWKWLSALAAVAFPPLVAPAGEVFAAPGTTVDREERLAEACEALSWHTETPVRPLGDIVVGHLTGPIRARVEAERKALYAALVDSRGEVIVAMPAAAHGAGEGMRLSIAAPPSPVAPYRGGEVRLQLVVDDYRCPVRRVPVAGLPAPTDPGAEVEAAIAQMEAMIARLARRYGYADVAAVRRAAQRFREDATADDLGVPAGMLPLIVAIDTADSLRAMTDAQAMGGESQRLFAALLASVGERGYAAEMGELVDSLQFEGDPQAPGLASARIRLPEMTSTHASSAGRARARQVAFENAPGKLAGARLNQSRGTGDCAAAISGDSLSITSAPALHKAMEDQRAAERAMDSTESLQGAALGFTEAMLPAATVVATATAGPVGAGATTAAGAFLYLHKLIQLYSINSLPSKFIEMEPRVLVPGKTIPEDFERAGGDARWGELMVTAESNGMDLTGPTIEGIQTALGAVGWAGSAKGGSSLMKEVVEAGKESLKSLPKDKAWELLQAMAEVDGCFFLAPETYGPIDITSTEYARVWVSPGTAIRLIEPPASQSLHKTDIELVHTGEATLNMQTRKDRFAGNSTSWAARITVQKARLEPEPSIRVPSSLGATKHFRIYPRGVTAPLNLQLRVEKREGGGRLADPPHFDVQDFRFSYRTPQKEERYPVVLEAIGQGAIPADGPGGSLERRAEIRIINEADLLVTPSSDCIGTGESRLLAAQLKGIEPPAELDWQIESGGGNLSGDRPGNHPSLRNNTYRAGGDATTARIRVTHARGSGESVSETIVIRVGDCSPQHACAPEAMIDAVNPRYLHDAIGNLNLKAFAGGANKSLLPGRASLTIGGPVSGGGDACARHLASVPVDDRAAIADLPPALAEQIETLSGEKLPTKDQPGNVVFQIFTPNLRLWEQGDAVGKWYETRHGGIGGWPANASALINIELIDTAPGDLEAGGTYPARVHSDKDVGEATTHRLLSSWEGTIERYRYLVPRPEAIAKCRRDKELELEWLRGNAMVAFDSNIGRAVRDKDCNTHGPYLLGSRERVWNPDLTGEVTITDITNSHVIGEFNLQGRAETIRQQFRHCRARANYSRTGQAGCHFENSGPVNGTRETLPPAEARESQIVVSGRFEAPNLRDSGYVTPGRLHAERVEPK